MIPNLKKKYIGGIGKFHLSHTQYQLLGKQIFLFLVFLGLGNHLPHFRPCTSQCTGEKLVVFFSRSMQISLSYFSTHAVRLNTNVPGLIVFMVAKLNQ